MNKKLSRTIWVYKPKSHKGNSPIRVLQHNLVTKFEKTNPGFLNILRDEVIFRGLQRGITYKIINEPINESASIGRNRKIEINEIFLSFIWCLSYSLFVIYLECIQKPLLNNEYTGKIELSNPFLNDAIRLFEYGFSLFKRWTNWNKKLLPNPEKYAKEEEFYIEKANSIYEYAIDLILCHEFAHQYYDHISINNKESNEESKQYELDADDYSINELLKGGKNIDEDNTIKFGIIAGLGSLIFFDETMKGGERHPDPDQRLRIALDKLNINEQDEFWGIASLIFILWAKVTRLLSICHQHLEQIKNCSTISF